MNLIGEDKNHTFSPWVEKYRPPSTKDMAGFEQITLQLKKFIENFYQYHNQIEKYSKALDKESDPRKKKKLRLQLKSSKVKFSKQKASMLIGPPGIGKTTVVYALANDLNMSVIELNASDTRTKDALQEKLHETVRSTNLLSFTSKKTAKKLILIDEVDGLHGRTDRGGVSQLKAIIEETRFPIIMTCNFKDTQKFGALYKLANPLISIPTAQSLDVEQVLTQIASAEHLEVSTEKLKTIANRSKGDFRAAINDLQGLAQGNLDISDESFKKIHMNRDSESNVQDLMNNLFHTTKIQEAKHVLDEVQSHEIDYRTIHRWIHENLLDFITYPFDRKFAYDNLSRVDTILGYIGRTQDYQHLSYFYDILAGGIRFSKHDKKIPQKTIRPPRWFRTRAVPDDELASILQHHYRVSLNTIMQEIRPKLKYFINYNSKILEYLGELFNLSPDQVKKEL